MNEFKNAEENNLFLKTKKIILNEFRTTRAIKRLKCEIYWFKECQNGNDFAGFVFSCARILNLSKEHCFKYFLRHCYNDCCEHNCTDPVSKGIESTYNYLSKKMENIILSPAEAEEY